MTQTTSVFLEDVVSGLSAPQKHLPSKYFYDKRGDNLFQQIMEMPEYYLTRAELEIFLEQSKEIIESMKLGQTVHVYEFGAGDGVKSLLFLEALLRQGLDIHFHPIDISQNALDFLQGNLLEMDLKPHYQPIHATYQEALESLPLAHTDNRIFMFIGSSIGNLTHPQAREFLAKISDKMTSPDYMLLGVDKMKDPNIILDAYNDASGVTSAFNLNLLRRINDELGGDFNLDDFEHYPTYNPETGETKSYLMSLKDQTVTLKQANLSFSFKRFESIHTELSQKYTPGMIKDLANSAFLHLDQTFTDKEELFLECLLTKNP
ncbi:MAG: Histidine N-alpha-methyltransferase [Chlamydiia bacterium]|nr:Histidine N-alpha-methyltransferase [Chlamydiia bacterium]MCH9616581.1 Histidine N-alpha-methyltransferase [Chlamydiia bacterium]MCH9629311.1 Histidine N-alpha-methyltransferase [Chlamydiia bacterium]